MSWAKNGSLSLKFRKRFDPGRIEIAMRCINSTKFQNLFSIDTYRYSRSSIVVKWRVLYQGHLIFEAAKVGSKILEFSRIDHLWYPYFQLAFARGVMRETNSVCEGMPHILSLRDWMKDITSAYDNWLGNHFSLYKGWRGGPSPVNMDSIPMELRDL